MEALLLDFKLCLSLVSLLFLGWSCLLPSVLSQNLLSCDSKSPDTSGYSCSNGPPTHCGTFAVIRTNSNYSSLFNLSFYLGVNKSVVAETNGFSTDTEFLPKDQPFLIPIDCKCNGHQFFEAELTKTTIKGDSFYGIAQSLEGLTTCNAIRDRNPGVPPSDLGDRLALRLPLRCACPVSQETKLFLSYPVKEGDSVSSLASRFNTTEDAIVLANNSSSRSFDPDGLTPLTSILIPLKSRPMLDSFAKPSEPDVSFPSRGNIRGKNRHRNRSKMWTIGIYIALSGIAVGVTIAIAAVVMVVQLKRRSRSSNSLCKKPGTLSDDVELQQLNLSVRTTSDKKVSFEGSQGGVDGHGVEATPRKMVLEAFTFEELRKETEDFSASNHIGGSVYHGSVGGKSLAIKRARAEVIAKIDFGLFQDATHKHPNIIRLLGTCLSTEDGLDSYLVFEYAKNGSLKDWIHHGLAIKSQFIASCNCFLTWQQRLRICLDVAMALQYMHHIMSPSYVHRNVKSRNIFLDEEFNAKLGNFGMAGCVNDEHSDDSPVDISSCSRGYLAPEYISHGTVSPSLDVFAYGVVLMEVLTGQAPVIGHSENGKGVVCLWEKFKSILQSESFGELKMWMDSAMGEQYSLDGAIQLANLAGACTEEDPSLRPSAGEVVEQLLRMVEELPDGDHSLMSESCSKPLVKGAFTGQ